mmetsp:Transcript_28482/g.53389  ORF Transcript_28482/g.53389 Transcript_28482/m.53389 type:complete len:269 (-) Transcript_28482:3158-3964(-)
MEPGADDGDGTNGRIARERPVVQRQDHRLGGLGNGLDNALKDHFGLGARGRIPQAQRRVEHRQQQEPPHHGGDGHEQRWHQPVPNLEIGLGHFGRVAQHRRGDKFDERLCQERGHADHNDQNHEDCRRHPKARRRVMWLGRIVVAHGAKEHVANQAETVSGREQRAKGRKGRHQPWNAKEGRMRRLLQHHFLGQEPIQERNARHRQGRQRRNHKGHRHQFAQTAKSSDIPRMGFVINDARRHKEGCLECGVVENVEHRRHRAKGGAGA